jgi:hypothetical protein
MYSIQRFEKDNPAKLIICYPNSTAQGFERIDRRGAQSFLEIEEKI